MGKLTISMAMFNSYVKLPEGKPWKNIGTYGKNHELNEGLSGRNHRTK